MSIKTTKCLCESTPFGCQGIAPIVPESGVANRLYITLAGGTDRPDINFVNEILSCNNYVMFIIL